MFLYSIRTRFVKNSPASCMVLTYVDGATVSLSQPRAVTDSATAERWLKKLLLRLLSLNLITSSIRFPNGVIISLSSESEGFEHSAANLIIPSCIKKHCLTMEA
ncbi:unnamed protein product [Schistosoma mattheei]|uniref:Uncharacterized protein n=2 Tax=Schistosoma TaxID=6181 RepID=A0A3P8JBQ8_9TREM|nr:unnamed protein product [Schistosoma mattheei]